MSGIRLDGTRPAQLFTDQKKENSLGGNASIINTVMGIYGEAILANAEFQEAVKQAVTASGYSKKKGDTDLNLEITAEKVSLVFKRNGSIQPPTSVIQSRKFFLIDGKLHQEEVNRLHEATEIEGLTTLEPSQPKLPTSDILTVASKVANFGRGLSPSFNSYLTIKQEVERERANKKWDASVQEFYDFVEGLDFSPGDFLHIPETPMPEEKPVPVSLSSTPVVDVQQFSAPEKPVFVPFPLVSISFHQDSETSGKMSKEEQERLERRTEELRAENQKLEKIVKELKQGKRSRVELGRKERKVAFTGKLPEETPYVNPKRKKQKVELPRWH